MNAKDCGYNTLHDVVLTDFIELCKAYVTTIVGLTLHFMFKKFQRIGMKTLQCHRTF